MQYFNEHTPHPEQLKAAISAFEATVGRFDVETDPDPLVNALLDLPTSRSQEAEKRRQLGETLFAALNKRSAQRVNVGDDRETFSFQRFDELVEIKVDDALLAKLPRDDAIRLATLLHGRPAVTASRAA